MTDHLGDAIDKLAKADDSAESAPVIDAKPGDEITEERAVVEYGLTGLKRSSGDVTEEWKSTLAGGQAIKVYTEMKDTDAVIGGILHSIQMLIRQVEWNAVPFDQEKASLDNAQFLKEVMDDMNMTFHDTISEVVSMLPFGWSYHEIVYKRRVGPNETDPAKRSKYTDGKIGWRKIPIRSQDTLEKWEFDEHGGIRGMWQTSPPDYEQRFIPIEKALLFRTSVTKNNPEGRSILRNAYRSYVFKKRFEEIEGIGVERDLAGIPMALVDPKIMRADASPADKAIFEAIKTLVVNLRRDQQEGIVFPKAYDDRGNLLYELTLLNSGGARQYNTEQIIDRYDRRMAQSVLADFIMLGHESVGSFALSSSKTKLFAVALGAWLDMIAGVFNEFAIPRLFHLNGIDENLPRLEHTDLEIPDLAEIGDFLSKLAGIGMIIDDDATEDHLRSIAKLPPRPMTEERLRDQIRAEREKKTLEQLRIPLQQENVPGGEQQANEEKGGNA